MAERLGLDPAAIESIVSQVVARIRRTDAIVASLHASVEAAADPVNWGLPDASPVMKPWSIPIACSAIGHLQRAASNAWAILAQLRTRVDDQRYASSSDDESFRFGFVSARLAGAFRATLQGDPTGLGVLTPAQRRSVFDRLGRAEIAQLARDHPGSIGSLEGAPYWARSIANLQTLDAMLSHPERLTADQLEAARYVRGAIDDIEARRAEPAQLVLLDLPASGGARGMRAAIGYGDLDRADHIGVLVPGMDTTIASSIDDMVHGASNLQGSMAAYGKGKTGAVLAWIGYTTPDLGSVVSDELAEAGAARLVEALSGLNAVSPDARLTVFAHSYGTRVATYALASGAEGASADGLFLFGSPGIAEGITAERLDVPTGQVYATRAADDRVAPAGLFASQPGADHVVAAGAGAVGSILLGPIGGAAGGLVLEGYLADPGGPNLDPTDARFGARVLGSDGDEGRIAVGAHDQTNGQGTGYLDQGTDSLHDMAMVGIGSGREVA